MYRIIDLCALCVLAGIALLIARLTGFVAVSWWIVASLVIFPCCIGHVIARRIERRLMQDVQRRYELSAPMTYPFSPSPTN